MDEIWRFYRNAHGEPALFGLDQADVARLFDYYCGYGNLDRNPAYFRHQFCAPLHRAIATMFERSARPRVLDLCCGVGTPTLLFALLGAEVTAVDYDEGQLSTLQHRLGGYSRAAGRNLELDLHQADLKTTRFANFGRFDAIYSHFGIDQLDTARGILARAAEALGAGGNLILKAMNPDGAWCAISRARPPVEGRRAFLAAAKDLRFQRVRARGTGVPRPLWIVPGAATLASAALADFMSLNTSVEYIFQYDGSQANVDGGG